MEMILNRQFVLYVPLLFYSVDYVNFMKLEHKGIKLITFINIKLQCKIYFGIRTLFMSYYKLC